MQHAHQPLLHVTHRPAPLRHAERRAGGALEGPPPAIVLFVRPGGGGGDGRAFLLLLLFTFRRLCLMLSLWSNRQPR